MVFFNFFPTCNFFIRWVTWVRFWAVAPFPVVPVASSLALLDPVFSLALPIALFPPFFPAVSSAHLLRPSPSSLSLLSHWDSSLPMPYSLPFFFSLFSAPSHILQLCRMYPKNHHQIKLTNASSTRPRTPQTQGRSSTQNSNP